MGGPPVGAQAAASSTAATIGATRRKQGLIAGNTAYPARSEYNRAAEGIGGSMRMRIRDPRDGGPDRARPPKARGRIAQHEGDARAGARQGRAGLSPQAPPPVQPWAVEGPVQAEVFVLRMRAGRPELGGTLRPGSLVHRGRRPRTTPSRS